MGKIKNYLTIKEASRLLKKHPGTIRRWVREKKIPAQKLAGKYGIYLISRNDALEFMMQALMEEKSPKKRRKRRKPRSR